MKRICLIFIIVAAISSLCVSLAGCGHGVDADPYYTDGAGSSEWEDLLEGQEPLPLSILVRHSVDDAALESVQTFIDVLNSIDFIMPYVTAAKIISRYSPLPTRYDEISLIKSGELGGTAIISGNTVVASQFGVHCAVIADLSIDYVSYSNSKDTTISGVENARIIASSYTCKFYRNMHVDFKMTGNIAVNGGNIRELEFSADYTADNGVEIIVDSGVIDTIEGTRYCYYRETSDRTVCPITDYRTFEYEDVVQCGDVVIGRRECDPTIDTFYTPIYLENETSYPYEVFLRCSDEGLWTPPCPLDGSYNTCPPGGTCHAPDDDGWGYNAEDYGYCSCTDQ